MPGKRVEIQFSKLLVDEDNPRLLRHQGSQREAIQSMLRRHGEDVAGLAEHIVAHGRDPSDLMKVVPDLESDGFFVVLDGNRRLTAYRVLETPGLLPEDLKPSLRKRLKALSEQFEGPPQTELCVLYTDRQEAYPFIEIAHRGKLQGAGRAPWSGQAGARFDELTGKDVPHLKLFRFVVEAGRLSPAAEQRLDDFPITTLERLVTTPEAAEGLGFTIESGKVLSNYPASELLKGVAKVIEDLATKVVNSRSLNSQEARAEYVRSLPRQFKPDPQRRLGTAVPLESISPADKSESRPRSSRKVSVARAALVPSDLSLPLENPRLIALFSEMKRINLSRLTNAAAVLLRVFLEWSVEEYIRKHNMKLGKQSKDDKQGRRLLAVTAHMEKAGFATAEELKAVTVAASNSTSLINIETLHGYVHNTTFLPAVRDVRDSWDQLENFLRLLHESYGS